MKTRTTAYSRQHTPPLFHGLQGPFTCQVVTVLDHWCGRKLFFVLPVRIGTSSLAGSASRLGRQKMQSLVTLIYAYPFLR